MVVIFSGSKDTARAFVNAAAREYIMKMSKAALLPEEVKRFPWNDIFKTAASFPDKELLLENLQD